MNETEVPYHYLLESSEEYNKFLWVNIILNILITLLEWRIWTKQVKVLYSRSYHLIGELNLTKRNNFYLSFAIFTYHLSLWNFFGLHWDDGLLFGLIAKDISIICLVNFCVGSLESGTLNSPQSLQCSTMVRTSLRHLLWVVFPFRWYSYSSGTSLAPFASGLGFLLLALNLLGCSMIVLKLLIKNFHEGRTEKGRRQAYLYRTIVRRMSLITTAGSIFTFICFLRAFQFFTSSITCRPYNHECGIYSPFLWIHLGALFAASYVVDQYGLGEESEITVRIKNAGARRHHPRALLLSRIGAALLSVWLCGSTLVFVVPQSVADLHLLAIRGVTVLTLLVSLTFLVTTLFVAGRTRQHELSATVAYILNHRIKSKLRVSSVKSQTRDILPVPTLSLKFCWRLLPTLCSKVVYGGFFTFLDEVLSFAGTLARLPFLDPANAPDVGARAIFLLILFVNLANFLLRMGFFPEKRRLVWMINLSSGVVYDLFAVLLLCFLLGSFRCVGGTSSHMTAFPWGVDPAASNVLVPSVKCDGSYPHRFLNSALAFVVFTYISWAVGFKVQQFSEAYHWKVPIADRLTFVFYLCISLSHTYAAGGDGEIWWQLLGPLLNAIACCLFGLLATCKYMPHLGPGSKHSNALDIFVYSELILANLFTVFFRTFRHNAWSPGPLFICAGLTMPICGFFALKYGLRRGEQFDLFPASKEIVEEAVMNLTSREKKFHNDPFMAASSLLIRDDLCAELEDFFLDTTFLKPPTLPPSSPTNTLIRKESMNRRSAKGGGKSMRGLSFGSAVDEENAIVTTNILRFISVAATTHIGRKAIIRMWMPQLILSLRVIAERAEEGYISLLESIASILTSLCNHSILYSEMLMKDLAFHTVVQVYNILAVRILEEQLKVESGEVERSEASIKVLNAVLGILSALSRNSVSFRQHHDVMLLPIASSGLGLGKKKKGEDFLKSEDVYARCAKLLRSVQNVNTEMAVDVLEFRSREASKTQEASDDSASTFSEPRLNPGGQQFISTVIVHEFLPRNVRKELASLASFCSFLTSPSAGEVEEEATAAAAEVLPLDFVHTLSPVPDVSDVTCRSKCVEPTVFLATIRHWLVDMMQLVHFWFDGVELTTPLKVVVAYDEETPRELRDFHEQVHQALECLMEDESVTTLPKQINLFLIESGNWLKAQKSSHHDYRRNEPRRRGSQSHGRMPTSSASSLYHRRRHQGIFFQEYIHLAKSKLFLAKYEEEMENAAFIRLLVGRINVSNPRVTIACRSQLAIDTDITAAGTPPLVSPVSSSERRSKNAKYDNWMSKFANGEASSSSRSRLSGHSRSRTSGKKSRISSTTTKGRLSLFSARPSLFVPFTASSKVRPEDLLTPHEKREASRIESAQNLATRRQKAMRDTNTTRRKTRRKRKSTSEQRSSQAAKLASTRLEKEMDKLFQYLVERTRCNDERIVEEMILRGLRVDRKIGNILPLHHYTLCFADRSRLAVYLIQKGALEVNGVIQIDHSGIRDEIGNHEPALFLLANVLFKMGTLASNKFTLAYSRKKPAYIYATPLHISASLGDVVAVQALLQCGATCRVKKRNNTKEQGLSYMSGNAIEIVNPVLLAKFHQHDHIANILKMFSY